MASPFSPHARKTVRRSPLTGLVEIFQRKELDEKLRSFSLNIKKFLSWLVEADAVSLQEVVGVLRAETQG